MNRNSIPSFLTPKVRPRYASTRGVALILVLSILVLITVLVVSFFSSVTTERIAAESFSGGVNTRELVDSSVNLVIAQIIEGTRSFDGTTRLGWASQPGAIRTYTEAGDAHRIYKLYSASDMVQDLATGFPLGTDLPTLGDNWFAPSQSGIFTDLNSPVLVPDVSGSIQKAGERFSARYPIVDPTAQGLVEGFTVNSSGLGYAGSHPPAPEYDPTAVVTAGISNPAPMPVRWIYVLADGNFVSPTAANADGAVSFAGTPSPTAANPIVGRVAFWTDDETAKINVNTASEGVFWDRPWAATNANSIFGERTMAGRIPARNEFHRFPGHPASTSLSSVFGGLLPLPSDNDPARAEAFDAYYQLVPRGAREGTKAGTRSSRGNPAVSLLNHRLYSSVDEFFYNSGRLTNNANITPNFLEKTRFFLTSQSRAPEVNMLNLPRIGLWPIQANQPSDRTFASDDDRKPRNVKDRLIMRGSTLGAFPYYFSRLTTWPRSSGGFDYPRAGEPVSFSDAAAIASSQSPVKDWIGTGMERNQALYLYLQRLTDAAIPGYGGEFHDKYQSDRDQILTQMVDVIRSGLNTTPSGSNPNYSYVKKTGVAERQVVPLMPPAGTPGAGTKGFGRFFTIPEVAVQFYGAGTITPDTPSQKLQGAVNAVGAVLLFNIFHPTPGQPAPSWDFKITVEGMDNWTVNGTPLDFGSGQTCHVHSAYFHLGQTGTTAFNSRPYFYYDGGRRGFGRGSVSRYPYYSQNSIPVDSTASTFPFTGGPITIKIFHSTANVATDDPLQTLVMNFPNGNFPKPGIHPQLRNNGSGSTTTVTNPVTPQHFAQKRWLDGEFFPDNNDTVRSVRLDPQGPTGGDLRHLAGLRNVGIEYFRPVPEEATYASSATRLLHSFRNSDNNQLAAWSGNASATLVPGITLNPPPAAALGTTGAFMSNGSLGDWDNGNGILADGAYINKPDEGNQDTQDSTGLYLGGYFTLGVFDQPSSSTFSPNRQVASAAIFGSLPTGVFARRPWQTLLFNAQPAAGSSHPGFANPPDHVVLDWFHMPIVEPYAISEPLSTAGKINMNYDLAPYSHIKRNTGLRAVLKSARVMGIPDSSASTYKTTGNTENFRFALNLDETNGTLRGFEDRFSSGDIFRTASEICTISLVPTGQGSNEPNYAGMNTWWSTRRLTGDNARESAYNHIYPRLTTKSNSFTVHYKVQALKKALNTSAATWVEGRDMVKGELRGSTTIERYVDPADSTLPDFATDSSATLDSFYRWRVLSAKRFNP